MCSPPPPSHPGLWSSYLFCGSSKVKPPTCYLSFLFVRKTTLFNFEITIFNSPCRAPEPGFSLFGSNTNGFEQQSAVFRARRQQQPGVLGCLTPCTRELRVFDNRTNTFATNILEVLKSACTENSSRSSSIIVGRNDHLHHHRHYFQPVRGHQGGREKILPNPCTFQAAQCQARRTRSDLSLNHVCF